MSPTPADTAPLRIDPAEGPADLGEVRVLMEEYWAAFDLSPCFQGFARELAELPGAYAPPAGALLLARVGEAVAGVVALRPMPPDGSGDGAGEMKRLYVRPGFRGRGIARALVAAVLSEARARGYRVLRLDTLDRMTAARELYAQLGFAAGAEIDGVLHYEFTL